MLVEEECHMIREHQEPDLVSIIASLTAMAVGLGVILWFMTT